MFCLFFWIIRAIKKYPENKSSPNALKFKYVFFWNIWEYLALRTYQGELAPGHEGPGCAHPLGAPPAAWAHGGPPPLILAPTHSFFLPQTQISSSSTSSSSSCCHFDLLAQSTSHKTAWGDCSLVCDSSIGPISFCSSALFIANFCCLGDLFLSLHAKFIWSKVVLMHDIGSRHL